MQAFVPSQSDQLDVLIARLRGAGDTGLLVEHLQTAHAYLHGAMREECSHNLELARNACDSLEPNPLASEARQTITGLLDGLHPSIGAHWRHQASSGQGAPPATARGLTEFLHGSDTTLGIFYPKKHVVALFRSSADAQSAHDLLLGAGLRLWEVIAIPGAEVGEFIEQLPAHHSLWAALMTQLSRVLDTEAGLVDTYSSWARRGAAFVIAYSPTQTQAEEIFEVIEPIDPVAVHWFAPGYILHLM